MLVGAFTSTIATIGATITTSDTHFLNGLDQFGVPIVPVESVLEVLNEQLGRYGVLYVLDALEPLLHALMLEQPCPVLECEDGSSLGVD